MRRLLLAAGTLLPGGAVISFTILDREVLAMLDLQAAIVRGLYRLIIFCKICLYSVIQA